MAVTRLSDWGWQVNLSGDLLSGEWWHHDKTECHHFAVAGKEIGREMAESWTDLHDAKTVPCPTTQPCFHQRGFVPLLYSLSRLLIGVHVFQIGVRSCAEKNSFIRCQSFVLSTRESSFNILAHIFWTTVWSRWLFQCCGNFTSYVKFARKIICSSLHAPKHLTDFFCGFSYKCFSFSLTCLLKLYRSYIVLPLEVNSCFILMVKPKSYRD